MTLSVEYRDQLRILHDRNKGWGSSARRWEEPVRAFGRKLGAKTVLDYGCGKGHLKIGIGKEFKVHEYDPGIPGLDADPPVCDLVAALDVMEHIEYDYLDQALRHMADKARLGLVAAIAKYPSGTRLPDGRDSHLILESTDWWIDRLKAAWPDCKLEWEDVARPCRNPRPEQVVLVKMEKPNVVP